MENQEPASALIFYKKKNLKKKTKKSENKSERFKLFDNASAEASLTALCNDFVPTSDFIMRKFVRKHRRTADYIRTHRERREGGGIDIRMLYDNAGTVARAERCRGAGIIFSCAKINEICMTLELFCT